MTKQTAAVVTSLRSCCYDVTDDETESGCCDVTEKLLLDKRLIKEAEGRNQDKAVSNDSRRFAIVGRNGGGGCNT